CPPPRCRLISIFSKTLYLPAEPIYFLYAAQSAPFLLRFILLFSFRSPPVARTWWKQPSRKIAKKSPQMGQFLSRRNRAQLRLEELEGRIVPTQTTVYVDDNWTGTAVGTTPANDPVGGLVFGTNAFADIPTAIANVTPGGQVIIFGGNYSAAVNANANLVTYQVSTNALIPADTTVNITGAVTL